MDEQDSKEKRLEREILREHPFSFEEAVGRLAGSSFKGGSPVSRQKQAELEISQALRRHLPDPYGALRTVLARRVVSDESFLSARIDHPVSALARVVESIVGKEESLEDFVREVDVEWGLQFQERPMFQREGEPAKPDDPYTFDSVREDLESLLANLQQ